MLREIYNKTIARLESIYGRDEASAIVRRLFEDGYGIGRMDLLTDPEKKLTYEILENIEKQVSELENERPIQYIVGFEEFLSRRFSVNESVLIPRQETEELVTKIMRESRAGERILDIGTGSGAIAISLALEVENSVVDAWDFSVDALGVARMNAENLSAGVNFSEVDILKVAHKEYSPKWDVIVSNPPYVLDSERLDMKRNVKDFEPHTALFVPDDDPLLFYRAIAEFASINLATSGRLYFEINQRYGNELVELLRSDFKDVTLQRDIHGADRMISCRLKD